MTDELQPLAYRINDAARVAGISRATLYRLIDAGELHPFKVGHRTLIDRDDLKAFLARCREKRAA